MERTAGPEIAPRLDRRWINEMNLTLVEKFMKIKKILVSSNQNFYQTELFQKKIDA